MANNMIALITPTGGRPKQFELCKRWMQQQTYTQPVLWVVVDDCVPITADIPVDFRDNWEIVRIYPTIKWEVGKNTQASNLKCAINELKKRSDITHIFIVEDDDYYRPEYLERMMNLFGEYDLIGERNTLYFNKQECKVRNMNNTTRSSLFQSAFTFSILSIFDKIILQNKTHIDTQLWKQVRNSNLIDHGLSIGVKGFPGRGGIGVGHRESVYNDLPSIKGDFQKLKMLFGDDYKYYINE